ncbi:ADP-ribosylglycohydrolase family protein [Streptomyces acidicola]|uniref:ADP-ribosylglycohydrolase family protein n=1 Tax=Streptomyces acidicola TaxID=2596892 RepID=UPI0037A768EA
MVKPLASHLAMQLGVPSMRCGSTVQRIRDSATPFEAVPVLVAELAPTVYSHACVATETLPVAFTLTELSAGDLPTALGAAALVSRQSDSMPAMVGALCGAA